MANPNKRTDDGDWDVNQSQRSEGAVSVDAGERPVTHYPEAPEEHDEDEAGESAPANEPALHRGDQS